jgi:integrase
MGFLYERGTKIWVKFKDGEGEWRARSSGFNVGEESKAKALLRLIEKRIEAGETVDDGPLTLKRYADGWLKARRDRGVASVDDDESRFGFHIAPLLGSMALADIRPHNVRDFVRALRARKSRHGEVLAPRTIRNIYFTLQNMLHDAVVDELIPNTPCVLRRGDLPKKTDKDPTWRATAVFTTGEVETIISDERTPYDRRVLYGLLFLACVRFGEASALRWRAYDSRVQPLGRLSVHTSFSTRAREEKSVKTDNPRLVPVHPTLAKMLATWRLSGWRELTGRAPTDDDLIIPSRVDAKRNRSVGLGLERFHEDLERLGLRPRRQHDARRTFISLALAGGAHKDRLRWVTHGPTGDIVDAYTTLPWETLCSEVLCLKIEMLAGRVLPLRAASGATEANLVTPRVTVEEEEGAKNTKPSETKRLPRVSMWRAVRDSNPWPPA